MVQQPATQVKRQTKAEKIAQDIKAEAQRRGVPELTVRFDRMWQRLSR